MPVELSDSLAIVRPFQGNEADELYAAARESIVEISPWMPWCHADYSRGEAERFVASRSAAWEKAEEYAFAIYDRHARRFVGCCGINQIDPERRRGNLGYWIRTSATNRGMATAATRLAARHAFATLKLQRIEIVAAVGNIASQRVAAKAGAVREGLARNRIRLYDAPRDAVIFSLIPADLD